MKVNKVLSSLLIAGCCLGLASTGFAATCSNLLGPIAAPGPKFPGNNCGNNAAFNGAGTFCGGVSYSNTGTDVWQVTVGPAQNFTFSVTSAVFTPDIAIFSPGACTVSDMPALMPRTIATVRARSPQLPLLVTREGLTS